MLPIHLTGLRLIDELSDSIQNSCHGNCLLICCLTFIENYGPIDFDLLDRRGNFDDEFFLVCHAD